MKVIVASVRLGGLVRDELSEGGEHSPATDRQALMNVMSLAATELVIDVSATPLYLVLPNARKPTHEPNFPPTKGITQRELCHELSDFNLYRYLR